MLQQKIKIILLVWPIVLLLGMWGNASYQRNQIDRQLLNADGLIWKAGEAQFEVQMNTRENGEKLEIDIVVIDSGKNQIYKKTEHIDRDMFGGGFVRAVQVDPDFENEIVVWHSQAKYYLDFAQGHVNEVSFEQVPQQVKALAKAWHKYNVMAGLETVVLLLFIFCYYTLYILVKGILKLFKKKRHMQKINPG